MDTVGVAGMGVLCSIGAGVPAFRKALEEGRSGIGWLEDFAPFTGAPIGARVKEFSFSALLGERRLPASLLRRAQRSAGRSPLSLQASIACALEAWEMAGLHERTVEPSRVALIVACDSSLERYSFNGTAKLNDAAEYLSPRFALHALASDHVGTVSEVLEIHGDGFAVAAASATGNVALVRGLQLLKLGEADICIVVGALSELSPLALQAFHNMGAIYGSAGTAEPESACRPFDSEASGFVYGQGAACLVLETSSSARQRGCSSSVELAAGACVLDGNSSSNPSQSGECRVMLKALSQGNLQPSMIDYVNAHATSTPLGDRTELAALQQVFGAAISRVWLNSTKSLVGHCLFSAGVVEAVATVLQMQHGFVHPNLNLQQPIARDCRFAGPRESIRGVRIATALSNSFGFGGVNSSIVFRAARPGAPAVVWS